MDSRQAAHFQTRHIVLFGTEGIDWKYLKLTPKYIGEFNAINHGGRFLNGAPIQDVFWRHPARWSAQLQEEKN